MAPNKRRFDDLRGVLAAGVREAARLCARVEADAVAAYRAGRKPRVDLSALRRPLAESSLLAYLLGVKRARQSLALRLSAQSTATRLLAERLAMPSAALRSLAEKFDAAAVRVLRDVTNAVESKVEAALLRATEQGLHVEGGVGELREAFRAAGLVPRNSFTLEAIYRTQTQQAYSAAQWQETHDLDELWGYRYSTVGDNRVRESHAAMEGVTLPKDHPAWDEWVPPNGWACRCTLIPLFQEEDVVEPPPGVEPDEGFGYNPGEVFAPALAASHDVSDQPREPAGSPEGGRWTSNGAGGSTYIPPGRFKELWGGSPRAYEQWIKNAERLNREAIRKAPSAKTVLKRLMANEPNAVAIVADDSENFQSLLATKGIFSRGHDAGGDVKLKRGSSNACHSNSVRLYKKGGYAIESGYALSKDGLWREHSWVREIKTGIIVETTEHRLKYFGVMLKGPVLEKFVRTNSPAGRAGLRLAFDESEHPREPAGSPKGGQWTSSGSSTGYGAGVARMPRKEIFQLEGVRLKAALEQAPMVVLRPLVADWQSEEKPTSQARRLMARVLPHTLRDGVLAEYHPGEVTVYRGTRHRHSGSSVPRSWTTDQKIARGFGHVVDVRRITRDTLALSLDKVLGPNKSEGEVVL